MYAANAAFPSKVSSRVQIIPVLTFSSPNFQPQEAPTAQRVFLFGEPVKAAVIEHGEGSPSSMPTVHLNVRFIQPVARLYRR
jgi:hypothetical protein